MAYDKEKIYKQAKVAITKNNLFFIEDIVAFIPCDKTTFYRFFPLDCNEYNDLRGLLDENKVQTKSKIREKLSKSDKAAELLALYRLICTPDEHRKLNQQYTEHSGGLEVVTLTPEQREARIAEIEAKAIKKKK